MAKGMSFEKEDKKWEITGYTAVSQTHLDVYKRQAQDFMKVGDEVEAVVLTLDREERKMSLGIKQRKSDPVSYTHLDVYKRQGIVQCRVDEEIFLFPA